MFLPQPTNNLCGFRSFLIVMELQLLQEQATVDKMTGMVVQVLALYQQVIEDHFHF